MAPYKVHDVSQPRFRYLKVWLLMGCGIAYSLHAWSQPYQGKSAPFVYEGYNDWSYKHYHRKAQYVTLSDGIDLAVDMLFPATEDDSLPARPVVFMMTPYNRSFLAPRMNPFTKALTKILGLGWGPEFPAPTYLKGAELLLEKGYILVVADMRGTGASFGSQMPLMPQLGKDGKEIIDWIADQSWCNGRVGMMGPSYLGWIQFLIAAEQPEALKCIMPEVMAFDIVHAGDRPGGILAQRWVRGFSKQLQGYNLNVFDWRRGLLPSIPVVDEDEDGDLQDEWHGLNWAIMDSQARPRYRDKNPNRHLYVEATRAHLDNLLIEELGDSALRYLDSPLPEPYDDLVLQETNPGFYADKLAESRIPIYLVGGWFDGFVKGPPVFFSTLQETNPVKLMMAPRHHVTLTTAYQKYFRYKEDYQEQLAIEQLRFFDRYLNLIPNGIDTEPPVYLYVMHKGWQSYETWPPRNSSYRKMYATSEGLVPQKPADATAQSYQVDFGVTSSYGRDSLNRWIMYRFDRREVMDRTSMDQRCLVFDSKPLLEDVTITGHPIAHIWMESSQAYGDLFVYLCDVDEKGKSLCITEGQLRGGWARQYPLSTMVNGKITPKPTLPWHGYLQSQWQDSVFAHALPIEMVLDLLPTSYVFQKGHKIRISLAGADYRNFELHPRLCPDQRLGNCLPTTWSIYQGGALATYIDLPIESPKEN